MHNDIMDFLHVWLSFFCTRIDWVKHCNLSQRVSLSPPQQKRYVIHIPDNNERLLQIIPPKFAGNPSAK